MHAWRNLSLTSSPRKLSLHGFNMPVLSGIDLDQTLGALFIGMSCTFISIRLRLI